MDRQIRWSPEHGCWLKGDWKPAGNRCWTRLLDTRIDQERERKLLLPKLKAKKATRKCWTKFDWICSKWTHTTCTKESEKIANFVIGIQIERWSGRTGSRTGIKTGTKILFKKKCRLVFETVSMGNWKVREGECEMKKPERLNDSTTNGDHLSMCLWNDCTLTAVGQKRHFSVCNTHCVWVCVCLPNWHTQALQQMYCKSDCSPIAVWLPPDCSLVVGNFRERHTR